jgi:hypothetical protein
VRDPHFSIFLRWSSLLYKKKKLGSLTMGKLLICRRKHFREREAIFMGGASLFVELDGVIDSYFV